MWSGAGARSDSRNVLNGRSTLTANSPTTRIKPRPTTERSQATRNPDLFLQSLEVSSHAFS